MNRFIFFGTGPVAERALTTLCEQGLVPELVVTKPDSPVGRGLVLTAPHIKTIALTRGVEVLQPVKLLEIRERLEQFQDSLFVVVSYGKILPDWLLAIPQHKTINLHPSLLPKFRGPSPIESQILSDESDMGITVMELDAEMDHGPMIVQEKISLPDIADYEKIPELLLEAGTRALLEVVRRIGDKSLLRTPQDHSKATLCTKLDKKLGEISLTGDARKNWLTYVAFKHSVRTFFYDTVREHPIRVIITEATYTDGVFTPVRVIPEGKKEVSFSDYENAKRSQVNTRSVL